MKKILNELPARSLTNREIAKIVAGVMTGFVDWCGAQPVCDAIDHFVEFGDNYKQAFRELEKAINPPPTGAKTMDKKAKFKMELNREQRERREHYKITYACMTLAIAMENLAGAEKLKDMLKTMEDNDPSLQIWDIE